QTDRRNHQHGPPCPERYEMDLCHRQCRPGFARSGAFCVALAALLLAGLSFGQFARAQFETVTVGITNAATDAGFYIADKKGYFRAEGIQIKTTGFASAAGM